MPRKTSSGKSIKKCGATLRYCPDVLGTQGIRFKQIAIQDDEADGGIYQSLCPIDLSETEESLIGALWFREMLNGIKNKRTRWVVEMHVIHDLDYREIGEMLCISHESVGRILRGFGRKRSDGSYKEYPGILEKLRAKARA